RAGGGPGGRLVKLGIVLPLFSGDVDRVLSAAVEAEDLGFDGVFAFDHLFPLRGRRDGPALEAFTSLARVAAATERVAIGTLVARAILRPPSLVAKMVTTLDLMAPHRIILGIGTGDVSNHAEHDAYGFSAPSADERREHLAETVEAVRALVRGEAFPGGRHVPLLSGPLLPAPPAGGPPIWVGGRSAAVVRIAARVADGWNGWGLAAEDFRSRSSLLSFEAREAGRS